MRQQCSCVAAGRYAEKRVESDCLLLPSAHESRAIPSISEKQQLSRAPRIEECLCLSPAHAPTHSVVARARPLGTRASLAAMQLQQSANATRLRLLPLKQRTPVGEQTRQLAQSNHLHSDKTSRDKTNH